VKDSNERRAMLAIVLCLIVYYVWSVFFLTPPELADTAAAGELTFVHHSATSGSQHERFISGIQHGGARCLCFHVSKTNGFEWASRWW
jgi:hypothetical protein